jgi:hypothetical protein
VKTYTMLFLQYCLILHCHFLLQLNQPLLPSKGAKGGAAAAAGTAAAAGAGAKPAAGALVTATVVAVHELELEVAVGKVRQKWSKLVKVCWFDWDSVDDLARCERLCSVCVLLCSESLEAAAIIEWPAHCSICKLAMHELELEMAGGKVRELVCCFEPLLMNAQCVTAVHRTACSCRSAGCAACKLAGAFPVCSCSSSAAAAAAGSSSVQAAATAHLHVSELQECLTNAYPIKPLPCAAAAAAAAGAFPVQAAATAHLHVSELQERLTVLPAAANGNPLGQFKLQQQLPAAWLGHVRGLGHKRGKELQLSIRPSVLAAAKQQQQV